MARAGVRPRSRDELAGPGRAGPPVRALPPARPGAAQASPGAQSARPGRGGCGGPAGRAGARRGLPRRRSPLAWRSVHAVALALVLLAFVAESTRVETSKAKAPQHAAAPVAAGLVPGCPAPAAFRAAFASASAKTGVSAALLVATAYEESRMNPRARSAVGARGLLQLMPATAHELRLDGTDPATNVLAGARYLKEMIERFGSLDLGLP